jgi:hypothetical protein
LAAASRADAGIVDENIQARCVAQDVIREAPNLGERRQIGLIKAGLSALAADFGHEVLAPIPVAAVHKHPGAGFGELARHAAPDAIG